MEMIKNDTIFFHEDDYSLIEIIANQDLFETNDFFHHYSQQYINKTLEDLCIHVETFENVLNEMALKNIKLVYTGYSNESNIKTNCRCFCFENYALFYEYKDISISKIWLCYVLLEDYLNVYPAKLETALLKLGKTFNVFIVDWNEMLAIDMKDENAIIKYIEEILN